MKCPTAAFVTVVAAWVAVGPFRAEGAVPREEAWRTDVSLQPGTRTQAVATDSAGNTYVAGVATSGVTHTRFLQKLNGAGAQLWRFVSSTTSPYEITDQQLVVDEAGGALYVLRSSMVDVSNRLVSVARHGLGTGAPIWESSAAAARAPGATARIAGMGLGAGGVLWVGRQSETNFAGVGPRWSIQYRKLSAATGALLEDGVLAGSATTDRYFFELAAANDRLFVAYREEGPTDYDAVVTAFDIGAGSLVVLNPHEPIPCSATHPCRQQYLLAINSTTTFTDGFIDASQNFVLAGHYREFEPADCSPECFDDRYWYYPVVVKVDRANHRVFQAIEQGDAGARFTSGDSPSDDVTARVTAGASGSLFVLVAGEPGGGELAEMSADDGVLLDSRGADTYFSERFSGGGCPQWAPVWQPRALAAASAGRLVMTGQLPAYCSFNGFPPDLDTSRTVSLAPTEPAAYYPVLRVPTCQGVTTTCDSGTLLTGRDVIPGGEEPNQPNTLRATCADGISGTFHNDESIDRIRVFTSEGPLQQGKTAWIEVTVWAYADYSNDHLDLFYNSHAWGSNWTYLTTLTPTGPGLQTLRTSYIVPTGSIQAVRAQFRYKGTNAVCQPGGFNDRDDLAFTVADAARIDSALGAPRCSRVASACDSGLLLNGRGTIAGDAEPNRPNTLGSTCADGTGASAIAGSVDHIRVSQVYGWNPTPGSPTAVEVEARIASTTDRLDLYYTGNAAAPVWTYLTTVVPTGTGAQTLWGTYNLPAGSLQAVRASLRRQGALSTCPAGSFNDRDDLVFAVGQ